MWRKRINKQNISESLIYIILWLIILITPILYFKENGVIRWELVLHSWLITIPFFIFFIVNNYILLPFLLFKKNIWIYSSVVLVILLISFTFTPFDMKNVEKERNKDRRENLDRRNIEKREAIERNGIDLPPIRIDHNRPPTEIKRHTPPLFHFGRNNWIMILLIVAVNATIKLLFKSMRDEKQFRDLEKYSLETELNYLKAQINPHFFMNTLNNIHALIDIDQEKAKDTVIDLSKMMRYVLYDANSATVPLSKEIEFLQNYIELMRIRYTNKLLLTFSLPPELPAISLPPLLFLSFIENAFKHGVSYCHNSFINIKIEIESNKLLFSVENSYFHNSEDKTVGVGLENISKRLSLLYNDRYSLFFKEKENEYIVNLIIPIQ
ncbi:two-component sensor histidine kinase [Dysgonomonadaceae bacterium PH5-43]|nr:two-component sensor histidine kinase [Dysgonomonadaceae bacterium PH5-43]